MATPAPPSTTAHKKPPSIYQVCLEHCEQSETAEGKWKTTCKVDDCNKVWEQTGKHNTHLVKHFTSLHKSVVDGVDPSRNCKDRRGATQKSAVLSQHPGEEADELVQEAALEEFVVRFAGSGVPFQWFGSDLFVDWAKWLSNRNLPPAALEAVLNMTRHRASEIVREAYRKKQAEMIASLKNPCILLDLGTVGGPTKFSKRHYLCICIFDSGKSFFHSFHLMKNIKRVREDDAAPEPETPENGTEDGDEDGPPPSTEAEAELKWNEKVKVVVSQLIKELPTAPLKIIADSAAYNIKAMKTLVHDFPYILFGRCGEHILQRSIGILYEHCHPFNSLRELYELAVQDALDKGKGSVPAITEVKWNSMHSFLQYLNTHPLTGPIEDASLRDVYGQLPQMLTFLQPLFKAAQSIQRAKTTQLDYLEIMQQLMVELSSLTVYPELVEMIKKDLTKRLAAQWADDETRFLMFLSPYFNAAEIAAQGPTKVRELTEAFLSCAVEIAAEEQKRKKQNHFSRSKLAEMLKYEIGVYLSGHCHPPDRSKLGYFQFWFAQVPTVPTLATVAIKLGRLACTEAFVERVFGKAQDMLKAHRGNLVQESLEAVVFHALNKTFSGADEEPAFQNDPVLNQLDSLEIWRVSELGDRQSRIELLKKSICVGQCVTVQFDAKNNVTDHVRYSCVVLEVPDWDELASPTSQCSIPVWWYKPFPTSEGQVVMVYDDEPWKPLTIDTVWSRTDTKWSRSVLQTMRFAESFPAHKRDILQKKRR